MKTNSYNGRHLLRHSEDRMSHSGLRGYARGGKIRRSVVLPRQASVKASNAITNRRRAR